MASLQASDASRPGSAHSARSFQPPSHNPSMNDLAAESAFDDFAGRVAHMKGVFRLTAEKEQPADHCTPLMWLRAAFWWYLRGKAGLETLLQQRAKSRDVEHRELLAQPHVDLAKTSWMLADPLERYVGVGSPDSRQPSDPEALLKRDILVLKGHLKSLALLMLRNNIMPPPQSLIQGQDTQIWLEYPRFTPDASAVLRGASGQRSLIVGSQSSVVSPSDALPLGDSPQYHYYHKCTVNISLNTDDVNTDRVSVPCNLTILRDRREYQSTVVISSQSELVHLRIAPRQSSSTSLTWHDVSWKSGSLAISINCPGGIDVTVRFFEHDFRTLWNVVDHSRKIDYNVRPEKGEVLAHQAQLVEVQYVDSSNRRAFPAEKVSRCSALLWERHEEFQHGGAVRKRHHGFRLVVATEPGHKSLSSFVHLLGADGPLNFEFITDAAAHGTTAMVIRIREEHRQCRILLVFRDMDSRQALYNKLNGIDVKEHETIVGKMALIGLNIQSVSEAIGVLSSGHNELASLDWQRLGVTNHFVEEAGGRMPDTVESESLRIVARHSHGCVTDRLNLDKGELLMRLPCTDTQTVQILRQPQTDMTMSIDARNAPHNVLDGVADVFKVVQNMTTVRTFKFATPNDLHAFQTAITGFTVRYDGLASTLAISRRMMVVPIYHKWAATNVRIQIVANAQNTVIKLLAFMEDFAHAEALCFQVKTTDVFETIKGDGKHKKWAIKMVDAKFTLPTSQGKDEQFSPEEKAARRFVNLEGLDYAQEHDDITVGFESQEGTCYSLSSDYQRYSCVYCLEPANIIHSPRRLCKSTASCCYRQSIHVHETHLTMAK
jgi:ribosomal protein L34